MAEETENMMYHKYFHGIHKEDHIQVVNHHLNRLQRKFMFLSLGEEKMLLMITAIVSPPVTPVHITLRTEVQHYSLLQMLA